MAVDWNDPCARFTALQAAYFTLLQGGTETLIRQRTDEAEQEVRFSAAKIDTLKSEMDAAQRECAAKTGTVLPRRRFAIRAGSRYQGSN